MCLFSLIGVFLLACLVMYRRERNIDLLLYTRNIFHYDCKISTFLAGCLSNDLEYSEQSGRYELYSIKHKVMLLYYC